MVVGVCTIDQGDICSDLPTEGEELDLESNALDFEVAGEVASSGEPRAVEEGEAGSEQRQELTGRANRVGEDAWEAGRRTEVLGEGGLVQEVQREDDDPRLQHRYRVRKQ